MKSDQLFIGIDSGTQGSKAIVFSRALGTVVSEGYASHEILENERGGREQHPHWWKEAVDRAVAQALESTRLNPKQVVAISVSGQQHGFVPIDAAGEVIRPAKLWCDTETVTQCRTLTEKTGGDKAVISAVGNSMAAGFTASKILWLKENEPKNYERLAMVLLPHDYINYWLTGEQKAEYGDASGTAFFDIKARRWSETVLRAIDSSGHLRNCLPRLMEPTDICGQLRPKLCARWGLSEVVIVAAGGGDNMMAAIGTGNVKNGVITASLGTSGTIYAFSEKPVIDREGELAAFCSSTGGWLPLVCTMNVTVATEQIRNLLGLDLTRFNREAEKAPPGAGGIILLPYFNGERTPALPEATATLSGMTSMNLTSENICRAGMEGVTFGLRYGLAVMQRNGITPKEIRLVGGGAKSQVWRQMVADILDCPVVSPVAAEAGALGAALQALWCFDRQSDKNVSITDICDTFVQLDDQTRCTPERNTATRYRGLYAAYRKLDQAMRPLNSELSR